ncbi:MAG: hypothetical protein F2536_05555 [Actinobacteria bacterium]|uniref:Unannotated protein n=1 Tax=freshwater metagenome TaxID=449393 RepID=A0A6J6CJA8_9ZZZZ|nr:hypothetical protein [Actinomycetota bacterium]MTA90358.1 hypothetical protein [Actinomycetota bacterium]
MTNQWFQISVIWAGVFVAGLLAFLNLTGEARFAAFGAIAAASIAIVSLEHLVSSKSKDTVRQQIYVSAGTILVLALFTLLTLIS